MYKKVYYTDQQIRSWVHSIMRDMYADNWKPDYIVGLSRGGLTPAVMMSHYLNIPMLSLDVSLRDGGMCVSNLGMAEDAFEGKKILIVDDINDTGATFNWIMEDWSSGCYPSDEKWSKIWNTNVRFAVLINNEDSAFSVVDYVGIDINKLEDPVWCVFPWENWWNE